MSMSLDVKKSLELQRFVLGERPEVRNCRFDSDKLVSRSAAASSMTAGEETVVYPGTTEKDTVRKQLELQRMIIQD